MKKKLITVLGILSLCTLGWHSTLTVQYFLGNMPENMGLRISGFALAGILTIHMIPAVYDMIKNAIRTGKEKFYYKYISESTLQNMSGIFLYGFALLHALFMELYGAFGTPTFNILWWISNIGLYLSVIVHLGVAVPHIMISCGIVTNSKLYKSIKIIVWAVNIALFAVLVYANTVFTFA